MKCSGVLVSGLGCSLQKQEEEVEDEEGTLLFKQDIPFSRGFTKLKTRSSTLSHSACQRVCVCVCSCASVTISSFSKWLECGLRSTALRNVLVKLTLPYITHNARQQPSPGYIFVGTPTPLHPTLPGGPCRRRRRRSCSRVLHYAEFWVGRKTG